MSDKKKLTETENKDFTFTPSSEKTPSFSTKKTLEQIKKEEPSINVTVNSSQNSSAADINQNLGSFGNVVVQPEQQTTIETKKQESTPNVNETDVSIPDAKVDFAKFSKTKRNKSSTRFGTKIDIWLRNNKTLLIIWLTILFVLIVILSTLIPFLVVISGVLNKKDTPGPWHFPWMFSCGLASNILSYIAILAPVIPFLVLMVTWFVGINGVYRGRIFHYFLWATLLLSFVLAITCWVVGGIVITQNNSFTPAA